ncbi:alpha/beta fold hydrolase [Novosphingobium sp. SL115]|uniref:alpha/beta hydrolase n=1 Tax=Novosphingobium sp. SL115 TaxID=2995150 RepID=UPI00227323F8|nr:alpha/beta fold hydrolase [Novosphingobium sp. SL115]MCY1672317.1 alpha/beta fold hydrolase [Novosphingobium sp. SL115]
MSLADSGRRLFLAALAAGGIMAPAIARSRTPRTLQSAGTESLLLRDGHDMAQGRFGVVHYRYNGPGRITGKTPLLCLHASPGSGIGFANFLREMGTDRLTIAADNPGFGLSDRPPHPSTIVDFAGAMSDLIDRLGLQRVDVVGSHTGSATAIELARQRPGAIHRIVLHSALMFTPKEIADYKARLEGSVPGTLNAAADRLPPLWQKFSRFRSELGDTDAWQLFWEMNRDPTHSGWGHDAAFAYDFAATVKTIAQPILVLNPKEGLSPITARIRGVAPNIDVIDLPYGDGLFSGHAADIAPLVRKHLDRKIP